MLKGALQNSLIKSYFLYNFAPVFVEPPSTFGDFPIIELYFFNFSPTFLLFLSLIAFLTTADFNAVNTVDLENIAHKNPNTTDDLYSVSLNIPISMYNRFPNAMKTEPIMASKIMLIVTWSALIGV